MESLLISIPLISISSLTWLFKVTDADGLLSFLAAWSNRFLPAFIDEALFGCEVCFSGWVAIILFFIIPHNVSYFFVIPYCFTTMYLTAFLSKNLNPYE